MKLREINLIDTGKLELSFHGDGSLKQERRIKIGAGSLETNS